MFYQEQDLHIFRGFTILGSPKWKVTWWKAELFNFNKVRLNVNCLTDYKALASRDAVVFPVPTLVSFLQELPDEKMHAHPRNL